MTINNRKELKSLIAEEQSNIYNGKKLTVEKKFRRNFKSRFAIYLKNLREFEYLLKIKNNSNGLKEILYSQLIKIKDRKLNKISTELNIEIHPWVCGKNIIICHQNVIITGECGENCIFHGNNILGNKYSGSNETPVLGDNVDVGFGALIIGNVYIADNCIIGAGSVVSKSFYEKGSVIAGVPAKKIR